MNDERAQRERLAESFLDSVWLYFADRFGRKEVPDELLAAAEVLARRIRKGSIRSVDEPVGLLISESQHQKLERSRHLMAGVGLTQHPHRFIDSALTTELSLRSLGGRFRSVTIREVVWSALYVGLHPAKVTEYLFERYFRVDELDRIALRLPLEAAVAEALDQIIGHLRSHHGDNHRNLHRLMSDAVLGSSRSVLLGTIDDDRNGGGRGTGLEETELDRLVEELRSLLAAHGNDPHGIDDAAVRDLHRAYGGSGRLTDAQIDRAREELAAFAGRSVPVPSSAGTGVR